MLTVSGGYERSDVGLISKYGVHFLNEATFAYSIYDDRSSYVLLTV